MNDKPQMNDKPESPTNSHGKYAQAELEQVARRLCWWQPEGGVLRDRPRFVAQVMALGTDWDIGVVAHAFGEAVFGSVLDAPPPGLFTPRRWNYWHVRCRRLPTPPLPRRFHP